MNNKKIIAIDGNTAAVSVAYRVSDVAAIYPITPSTSMAEVFEEWSADGKKNVFGNVVSVSEMQSEAGAAGAVHGSALLGALSTTFTASQGLLLMIPNMYKISGELLPVVFHVSARTVASQAINIFCDHSDVMACRQTGFAMLASNNVQEAHDLALIAHIAALNSSVPFLHFFDGFRTSHEIAKIEEISDDTINALLPFDKIAVYKANAHDPQKPKLTGSCENADTFFQSRESSNPFYNNVYDSVKNAMDSFAKITGRKYAPFEYYGDNNAKSVVVAIGSANNVIEETIDVLQAEGEKLGLLKVRLFRSFNIEAFVNALPKSVETLTILDRTKEPGSVGEPLFLDVVSAVTTVMPNTKIKFIGGRYGLGGKEILPIDVLSIYENSISKNPRTRFTIGINDDVTNLSLPATKLNYPGLVLKHFEMKFFGLGSDGTVSANKSSIKIIGETTKKFIQGHFEYDSKKSGGITISHLRFSDDQILSSYAVQNADFIAVHNFSYLNKYDVLKGLKNNGNVLLNTTLSADELGTFIPQSFKDKLVETNSKLFIIPAAKIASEIGMRNRINTIMQSSFFKITNIIDFNLAKEKMKYFAEKAYKKKGPAVLEANIKAIDAGGDNLIEIDVVQLSKTKTSSIVERNVKNKYYNEYVSVIEKLKGNDLPVSIFHGDGSIPTSTSQYEKRGISDFSPQWLKDKCIQCGQCTLVCPHAVIRSGLLTDEQVANAPKDFLCKKATGAADKNFSIQISPEDCTGCENCVKTCPVKALEMTNDRTKLQFDSNCFEYFTSLPKSDNPFKVDTVKGIQFEKPYFEFNGACAGCGETAYIKTISQLYGDHMVIANATGCSSIYSSSSPTCPYVKDESGKGPTWANSLFEDNAEFGYGMRLAIDAKQADAIEKVKKLLSTNISNELKLKLEQAIEVKNTKESIKVVDELKQLLSIEKANDNAKEVKDVLECANALSKKSVWIFGGDGWAYDIGYGGLDHVLSRSENVNVLVLDTEIYSNTGGQASKSSPLGATAKLAAGGKNTKKKNLALMAMSYEDIYVAQVAMGANQSQFIKAVIEAESYNGPSIIIAYAPCISHGINMTNTQQEEKKAVDCGYWSLFRYDPRKEVPLTIDSKEPTGNYIDFVKGENRYKILFNKNEEVALKMAEQAQKNSISRLKMVKAMGEVLKK